MRKQSSLWFSLCLSSLVFTVPIIAGTSVQTLATPEGKVTEEALDLAQTNPCASGNPCASSSKNIGGPLASQLQGKPVLVDIYASWCAACKNIAPTLSELKQEYGDRIHFIVLDVSDRSTVAEAEAKAKELGLQEFLAANKNQTGMITIIDPATGEILTQHRNNPNVSDYQSVLNAALTQ